MATHHVHAGGRELEAGRIRWALGLIVAFMAAEVAAGIVFSSLALLSDAAHMVTDAGALGLSLAASQLAGRPARGALTYGLGRAEILSAQSNGIALLVLALVIVYVAIRRLLAPPQVGGIAVIAVAAAGIAVNLVAVRLLAGGGRPRSLNLEGSYRHVVTDLYGFVATAIAGAVIVITGFERADAAASLIVAALMLKAAYGLLRESGRVFMEAAPLGLRPEEIGRALAAEPGVVEVHDLHVWEVTSGFPALSAHVIVGAGADCHALRRQLQAVLEERFGLRHTTLQVDHAAADHGPLRIEVGRLDSPHEGDQARPRP
jgi:cobalt-zinc-cadmium efflux system protein